MLALGPVVVAVMLGCLLASFHWVLAAVPGVAILIALLAALAAARPRPFPRLRYLRDQLDADVRGPAGGRRRTPGRLSASRSRPSNAWRCHAGRWSRSCKETAPSRQVRAVRLACSRGASGRIRPLRLVLGGLGVVRPLVSPASAMRSAMLGAPLLERYAREDRPNAGSRAAAAVALVVLVKPWLLLSITSVLARS